jgi:hypothetical protein
VSAALLLQRNGVMPTEKLIAAQPGSGLRGRLPAPRTPIAPDREIPISRRLPGHVLETPAERLDLTAFQSFTTGSEGPRESTHDSASINREPLGARVRR